MMEQTDRGNAVLVCCNNCCNDCKRETTVLVMQPGCHLRIEPFAVLMSWSALQPNKKGLPTEATNFSCL